MQSVKKTNYLKLGKVFKTCSILLFSFCFFYAIRSFADVGGGETEAKTIADLANNLVQSFESVGKLLIATAYLAGISFVVSSIFKFKQHRDNPQQIPLGTPIALFLIGVILIFLPGIITPAGVSIFGGSKESLSSAAGGFTGKGAEALPGGTN